jgi:hypothetical protein
MKTIRVIGLGSAALALVAGLCFAQAQQGPPKPGPEHQRLARYVGKWTGKGMMKAGPLGPGGPMTWTETCEWFAGGFNVVCRSEGKGPMGEMKGLGIMGFSLDDKVYTYYGIDNGGWADHAKGTVNGKVWTYTSAARLGGKTLHSRFTLTEVSDTSQTFKYEMSEDGKTWNLAMDGESSK